MRCSLQAKHANLFLSAHTGRRKICSFQSNFVLKHLRMLHVCGIYCVSLLNSGCFYILFLACTFSSIFPDLCVNSQKQLSTVDWCEIMLIILQFKNWRSLSALLLCSSSSPSLYSSFVQIYILTGYLFTLSVHQLYFCKLIVQCKFNLWVCVHSDRTLNFQHSE